MKHHFKKVASSKRKFQGKDEEEALSDVGWSVNNNNKLRD
jgi:hypothetical protein